VVAAASNFWASQSLRQFSPFPAANTKKNEKKSTATVNDLCKLCVFQPGATAFILYTKTVGGFCLVCVLFFSCFFALLLQFPLTVGDLDVVGRLVGGVLLGLLFIRVVINWLS